MTSLGRSSRFRDAWEVRSDELFYEWVAGLEVDNGIDYVLDFIGYRIEEALEAGEHEVIINTFKLCNENRFEQWTIFIMLQKRGYGIEYLDNQGDTYRITWECSPRHVNMQRKIKERVNERCEQYFTYRTSRKARREELWSSSDRKVSNYLFNRQ